MTTFTAIVPNYNDSAALPKALDSLLAQTSPFDEIIIVDDGSQDESRALITRYAQQHPGVIRVIQHDVNQGVIAALNAGLDAATGDFIIMCSSNDWYDAREVERCRALLDKYPGVTMVCGNSATWDVAKEQPGSPLLLTFPQEEMRYDPAAYVRQNHRATAYFNGGAVAMKRTGMLEFDKLQPELKWHTDLMMYLLFAYTDDFVFTPEILSTCRLDGGRSFSHGRFDWKQQKQVTAAMIRLFKTRWPEQGKLARASAMLPKYNFRALELFLKPECMWYVTPLLLWRIAVHTAFYWLRHYIPRPVLMLIRPFFRI